MKKIYQTIVDKGNGNCMQAAVASLFDLELNEVPHFLDYGTRWFLTLIEFYETKGYDMCCFNPQKDIELTKKVLEADKGVNGYWVASVPSKFFGEGVQHAVIIDKDLNVVHDPNPNNINYSYTLDDILCIDVCSDDWYIDVDGTLKLEKR